MEASFTKRIYYLIYWTESFLLNLWEFTLKLEVRKEIFL